MAPNKYEVVISGMSGLYPECNSVEELETKLMNKENMVTEDNRKWPPGTLNVPSATGKYKDSTAIDFKFFGLNKQLYEVTGPVTLLSLRLSFEAICDAGVNPLELSGSNIAVIVNSYVCESDFLYLFQNRYGLLGHSRTMQSNRVSFLLNFRGPSYTLSGAWTGGVQCLQLAHELISSGQCIAAVVTDCNTIIGPEMSHQYQAIGRLNDDGKTKCFSADADGYSRSEATNAFFLQRAEDAKRSYGAVLGVITKDYGTRLTRFTEFSEEKYKEVLEETYHQAQIDPSEVSFVEADGSASKVSDAMELNCIADVMCANRKSPLHIGCVKSNIGHAEAASSLASVAKALIALKTGIIPPNLHYTSPNPDVPALLSGQLKVITEPTPLNGDIVAVSSVGLGGTYSHIIIKGNQRPKTNSSSTNFPWLFLISGRTENGLINVLDKVMSRPFNEDFIRLSSNVFKNPIKGHTYKGYALFNTCKQEAYEIKQFDGERKPVWFMFSGMGSQWIGMGADLMRLPTFANAIKLCHEVLLPKGINLLSIIQSKDEHAYDSILHSFIGIAAIQIGLVDILKELDIEPDGMVGHSVGELGCAYADGCFTAEQTILAAYARGKASLDADLIKGMMAAVGMSYNQIKDQLPESIEVACHNSSNSCTLSGPVADMEQYVAGIKAKGIFAKLVNVSDIAYHSRYIKPAAPFLRQYLKEILPLPVLRSKRWISSSIPETSWDSDLAKYSSAEYHTNNLLSSVLFEEATAHIPQGAIVIEIAPHGLLQSIVKKSLSKCTNIPLVNKFAEDTLVHLFKTIGKLHLEGIAVNIEKLYPKIEYPISGDIPSIATLLTWEKGEDSNFKRASYDFSGSQIIKLSENEEKYAGYKINGKQVMPLTSLIWNAIEIFSTLVKQDGDTPILLEDVHFVEQIEMSRNLNSEIEIQLQKGSGDFEIIMNKRSLINGRLRFINHTRNYYLKSEENVITQPQIEMEHDEIYKQFEELSVEFKNSFKLIQKISFNETDLNAVVLWKGEWIEFLDALLMVVSLYDTLLYNELRLVQDVRLICIDFVSLQNFKDKEIAVSYNRLMKELSCEGLKMHMPLTRRFNILQSVPDLLTTSLQILPYYCEKNHNFCGQLDDCLDIIFINTLGCSRDSPGKLNIVFEEVDSNYYSTIQMQLMKHYRYNETDIIPISSEDRLDDLYFNLEQKDNLLIVGELPYYTKIVKCLKKVKAGFLLTKSETKIQKWIPSSPVLKLKVNAKLFTLHKTCYKEQLPKITVITNKYWQSELKSALKNDKKEENSSKLIYLVKRSNSLSKVYEITRVCQKLENSHLIRFLFVDDNAPPFSLDEPFYKDQISKDLVMNIYVDNTWGCLKLCSSHNKSVSPDINGEHQLIYPLSTIRCENVTLATLGLQLSDNEKHFWKQELNVLDYCGTDKKGNPVCGIGTLSDSQQLVEDKILSWTKPPGWSDEEAASVPLNYALACYMLLVKHYKTLFTRSVLVHHGSMPISQAVINVALTHGFTVFTTYNTVEEKNKIQQLFPQIRKENILLCKTNIFDVTIFTQTNYKGVGFVVNTSPKKSILKASINCVAEEGFMFQLNMEVLNHDCSVGMFSFYGSVSLHSLPAGLLLELPSSTKQKIQEEVQNGIKNGHVIPLQTKCIPETALNVDAVHMLDFAENGDNKKIIYRCVNTEDVNVEKSLYICSAEKSYIVISDGNSFLIDLINWLTTRGAKTIHVISGQDFANSTSLRLESITSNNATVEINLQVNEAATDREQLKNIVKEINSAKQISTIFLLGQDVETKAITTDSVLQELKYPCNVVCIGRGGETVCEPRRANCLPAFAISCQSCHINAAIILPLLDQYVQQNNIEGGVLYLEEDTTKSKSSSATNCLKRLPEDVSELLALNKKSVPKPCFIEITASGPQYKYNKEIEPIFVIPGLKPNEMDKLTSRMFQPTFEARLPQDIDNIEEVAKQLYEDLKQFKLKAFTLITNDWGGALGLHLAKCLKDDGKLVLLIMLDSSPQSVQSWAAEVVQMGDVNLINKYVKIPFEVKENLYLLPDWDQKVKVAVENSDSNETEKEGIRNGLNIVRNCLLAIMKYRASGEKFRGKYVMYRHGGLSQHDDYNITQREPVDEISTWKSHQDMLDDPEMARKINNLILFDHRTAAREINYEILDNSAFKERECAW